MLTHADIGIMIKGAGLKQPISKKQLKLLFFKYSGGNAERMMKKHIKELKTFKTNGTKYTGDIKEITKIFINEGLYEAVTKIVDEGEPTVEEIISKKLRGSR